MTLLTRGVEPGRSRALPVLRRRAELPGVALGIAAVAPFAARALATTFERHARAKSRRIVEGAERHDNDRDGD